MVSQKEKQNSAQAKQCDVLIVYADHSMGWNNQEHRSLAQPPFPENETYKKYNESYAYVLDRLKERHLSAAFTSTDHIVGPGTVQGYWTHDQGQWRGHEGTIASAVLLDNMSLWPALEKKAYDLIISDPSIHTFKSKKIVSVFRDKLVFYNTFPDLSIPSVPVTITEEGLQHAQQMLQQIVAHHPVRADSSEERYVIKGTHGAGGSSVFAITPSMSITEVQELAAAHPAREYLLQPFVEYYTGPLFGGYQGCIDLRVLLFDTQLFDAYIRIAKKGDFRGNASQGGSIVYIKLDAIPPEVREQVQVIIDQLDVPHAFYCLDFIRGKSGRYYVVEGNDSPGIIWFDPDDERRTKKVIDRMIDRLNEMVIHSKKANQ